MSLLRSRGHGSVPPPVIEEDGLSPEPLPKPLPAPPPKGNEPEVDPAAALCTFGLEKLGPGSGEYYDRQAKLVQVVAQMIVAAKLRG